MLKIVSIICLSLSSIIILGCSTSKGTQHIWPIPQKPQIIQVKWETKTEATNVIYYLSKDQAVQLANNVDEMKAYISKLELLVSEMTKFYGAKMEEYKRLEK